MYDLGPGLGGLPHQQFNISNIIVIKGPFWYEETMNLYQTKRK